MTRIILVFFIFTFMCQGAMYTKSSYLIEERVEDTEFERMSRGKLKEMLGEEIRDVVNTTIQVLNNIGELQVVLSRQELNEIKRSQVDQEKKNISEDSVFSDLSNMHLCIGESCKSMSNVQKILSESLESLIENEKPFRQASKTSLRSTISLVRVCKYNLRSQIRLIKGIIHQVKKSATNVNEDTGSTIKSSREMLVDQRDSMKKVFVKLEKNELIKQV